MTNYTVFEEIENDSYFLDATHPDIPNWEKTTWSFEIFGSIDNVIEFINNRIDEITGGQKNTVQIKRTKNVFNFEFGSYTDEDNERNEYVCKIYYVEQ
jgi:hypothetical protein